MNQVPNMISTKDLAYLKDMFKWNFNASKLAYHFSNETNNPIIKDMLMKVCHMHSRNCHKIKDILMDGLNEQ